MIIICNALGVRAAVALELRFDPIDRGAVPVRSLPPVAEFRQAADGRSIVRQVEPAGQRLNWIVFRGGLSVRVERQQETSRD